ncbi:hypothetical protein B0H16DRAFT_1722426 [Mycena metata]|uniref:Fungal N-terminal domain-containing protein n=1 Tax=Mycena metata TaxID=1033252 RepID=A0AAD7J516_9AGAR|nr:hypothetical protein B0H16DRAFT_1722426 [Mycena metata]
MEAVGAVTTIWTVVQGVKEIAGLVIQVRNALKQVNQNRRDHAEQIQQLLVLLNDVGTTCGGITTEPWGLSDATKKLQTPQGTGLLKLCPTTTSRHAYGWLNDFWRRDSNKEALQRVKASATDFLVRFQTCSNIRIERKISENSDKLDQLLSQDRNGSSPTFEFPSDTRYEPRSTKNYLIGQLEKLSKSLRSSQPPFQRISSPAHPDHLASITHRPGLTDTANGLHHAIVKTKRILELYNTDSAGDSAHSLDDLSIALMDVGLADEASQLSGFSVRIYGNIPGSK